MSRVAGHVIQRHLEYVETRWGEDALEDALGRCSTGVAAALRSAIVPGAWFPLLWLSRLQHAVIATTENPEAIYDLGYDTSNQFVTERGLATHVLSPLGLLRKMPEFLRESYHGPELAIDVGDRQALLRYRKCDGFDRVQWGLFEGGLVGMLEGTGAHEVEAEQHGGAEGECDLELRWRSKRP